MKKLRNFGIALIAIVVSMAFVACSDDDDNVDSVDSLDRVLVGEWKQGLAKSDSPGEMDLDDTAIDDWFSYKVFNSDGTGYEMDTSAERNDFKWKIIDDKIYLTSPSGSRWKYTVIKYNKKVMFAKNYDGRFTYKFVKM